MKFLYANRETRIVNNQSKRKAPISIAPLAATTGYCSEQLRLFVHLYIRG